MLRNVHACFALASLLALPLAVLAQERAAGGRIADADVVAAAVFGERVGLYRQALAECTDIAARVVRQTGS